MLSATLKAGPVVGLVMPVLAIGGIVMGWRSPRAADEDALAVFTFVMAVVAPPVALVALDAARLPSQYWYYLSLLVILGLACDVGVTLLARRLAGGEWTRLAVVGVGAFLV